MRGVRLAQKLKKTAKIIIFLRNIEFCKKMYAFGLEEAPGGRGTDAWSPSGSDSPKVSTNDSKPRCGMHCDWRGLRSIQWLYAVSCGELRRAKRRHSRVALPGSAAGQNRRRKKLQVAAQHRRARSAYDGAGSHATFPPTILRRDRARAPRRAISGFS